MDTDDRSKIKKRRRAVAAASMVEETARREPGLRPLELFQYLIVELCGQRREFAYNANTNRVGPEVCDTSNSVPANRLRFSDLFVFRRPCIYRVVFYPEVSCTSCDKKLRSKQAVHPFFLTLRKFCLLWHSEKARFLFR